MPKNETNDTIQNKKRQKTDKKLQNHKRITQMTQVRQKK